MIARAVCFIGANPFTKRNPLDRLSEHGPKQAHFEPAARLQHPVPTRVGCGSTVSHSSDPIHLPSDNGAR